MSWIISRIIIGSWGDPWEATDKNTVLAFKWANQSIKSTFITPGRVPCSKIKCKSLKNPEAKRVLGADEKSRAEMRFHMRKPCWGWNDPDIEVRMLPCYAAARTGARLPEPGQWADGTTPGFHAPFINTPSRSPEGSQDTISNIHSGDFLNAPRGLACAPIRDRVHYSTRS